jgi:hypothetical protein
MGLASAAVLATEILSLFDYLTRPTLICFWSLAALTATYLEPFS